MVMSSTYNRASQKPRRQFLRNHATGAEVVLWLNVKGHQLHGLKFRRQFGVGRYILDFYCPKIRLAIELDGPSHESPWARAYDQRRQKEIERCGIRFLRFTDDEVLGNVRNVVRVIEAEVQTILAEANHHPFVPSSM